MISKTMRTNHRSRAVPLCRGHHSEAPPSNRIALATKPTFWKKAGIDPQHPESAGLTVKDPKNPDHKYTPEELEQPGGPAAASLGAILMTLGVCYALAIMVALQALSTIFQAGVYVYATTGQVPPTLDRELVAGAFRPKG